MKKLIITTLAVSGLVLGAFAQGTVALNNQNAGGYVLGAGAAFYSGPLTIEVWVLPNAALDGQMSSDLATANTLHGQVVAANTTGSFDATGTGNTVSGSDGVFNFGTVSMPHVVPGASAEMAFVMFTGSQWGAAGGYQGIVVFAQPTGGVGTPPGLPAELTGWDAAPLSDANLQLALVPVPEPATFALAGLGAAAMMIFRRRK